MYAFIKQVYPDGDMLVEHFAGITEYEPHTDPSYDPFAAMFNVTTQNRP